MTTTQRTYGTELERSEFRPNRSVIASPETSPSGNLILRVGREHDRVPHAAWEQTEHVVMTPDEAINFAHHILAAVDS